MRSELSGYAALSRPAKFIPPVDLKEAAISRYRKKCFNVR